MQEIAQELASAHQSGAIGAGSSAMQGYRLVSVAHNATSGPMDCWKIYDATNKKPHAAIKEVSIWVLDKKALNDGLARGGGGGGGLSGSRGRPFETFLEQQRRGCTTMTKIRHPGVVRVIEPLDETSTTLVCPSFSTSFLFFSSFSL